MPRASGTVAFSFQLARELLARGHRVTLLATGEAKSWNDVNVLPVLSGPTGEVLFSLALWRVAWGVQPGLANIVVANGEHYGFPFTFSKHRWKIVLVAHGPISPHLRRKRPFSGWLFEKFVEPRVISKCIAVVAIDTEAERYYCAKYPRLKVTKLGVGVDLKLFTPGARQESRLRLGLPVEGRYIAVAARPSPEKDLDLAWRVFSEISRRLESARLLYAGGLLEEAFSQHVRDDLLSRKIHVLGPVDHSKVPDVLRASDVLLITSKEEQLPTIALEALACGIPVVSRRVGDMPLLLSDPRVGRCIDSSAARMAEAVLEMLGEIDAAPEDIAQSCRRVAEPFGWPSIGGAIAALCEEVRC